MSAEKEVSSPERLSGEMTRNRNGSFMGLLKLRRYYVAKSEVYQVISQINRQQNKRGIFVDVAVKPYRGKKYDPENTVVIVVG